jgi:hypothetical protein
MYGRLIRAGNGGVAGLGGEGGILGIDPAEDGVGFGGAGDQETDLDGRRADTGGGGVDDLKDIETEGVDAGGKEGEAEKGPGDDAGLLAGEGACGGGIHGRSGAVARTTWRPARRPSSTTRMTRA